jgi:nitroreductase
MSQATLTHKPLDLEHLQAVKTASASYPVMDEICLRWSPRAFADQPVESWKIGSLFEAARWAPSSFNEQPWRFIIANRHEDPEFFETMLDILVPVNQVWAKDAPVLILSVAKTRFTLNDAPNRHAYHDVGLAVENMMIQAEHIGLAGHQMAGFDVEKARAVLEIPEGFDPVAMIVIGYMGNPDSLPPELKERELAPRERRPLQDMLFTRYWGQTFSGAVTL